MGAMRPRGPRRHRGMGGSRGVPPVANWHTWEVRIHRQHRAGSSPLRSCRAC